MLNELHTLSASLASRGIEAQSWHPWIKPYKKGDAVVAEVDESGGISRVSLLGKESVAQLRKIEKDFHNSFPGFNLTCPVLKLVDSSRWNEDERLWTELVESIDEKELAYKTKEMQRVNRLLRQFPVNEIKPHLSGDRPKILATFALIERLTRAEPGVNEFLQEFAFQVVASGRDGRLPVEMALAILYGKPNKAKGCREEWRISLILDIHDVAAFPYRVSDPEVVNEWNSLLKASGAKLSSKSRSSICALTGRLDRSVGEKMPNPNLAILGPTYLMSMNKDIPCQSRYGKTSTSIFGVGEAAVQEINDALLYFTDPSRRNKTWASVPNGASNKSDLLVAYIRDEPDCNIPIVGLFADVELSDIVARATYEVRTEQICHALRTRNVTGKDCHVEVIVLSKIDKGRAQIIFSVDSTAAAIYSGRVRWLQGATNAPEVLIPMPSGQGKSVIWHSGYRPSPADVMVSFKRQWIRAGQVCQTVPGVDFARIIEILLKADARNQASWLLDRYIGLTWPLLDGLSRHRNDGGGLPVFARKEALVAIATYGILLLRQGRRKEIFMEDRDYVLGQFLQFADLLHRLYCKHERGNKIPPQLVGNAALGMAIQSPRRAIQALGNRMPVYLAWADRYSHARAESAREDDAALVAWCRRELGRLSAELKDCDLTSRVSGSGRAELFLGYLATKTKSERQDKV